MGWHLNDLTLAASGAPSVGGQATGYVFDAQGTQHVFYTASDQHVHELWWDSSGWHHNDLTVATGAPISAGLRLPTYSLPKGPSMSSTWAKTMPTSTNCGGTAAGGITTT